MMCIDKIKYLYMVCALIFLGSANSYTVYAMSTISVRLGFWFCALFSLFLIIKYKPKFAHKDFYFILGILVLWNLLQIIIKERDGICYSYFYDIILGLILMEIYRKEIYLYYEKAAVFLSRISIILWGLTVMFPNVMHTLLSFLSVDIDSGLCESNIFLFGLENEMTSITYGPFFRNVGFAWEPGRFACLLLPAILFNLARTKFQLIQNKELWILIIALITTFSTTGYAIMLFISIACIYNKKKKYFIPMLIGFSLTGLAIISLPFMRDKIVSQVEVSSESEDRLDGIAWQLNQGDESYVPSRFQGMVYEFINFLNDPWLGYGKDISNSFFGRLLGGGLVLYNGVIKIFAVFGIFIGILYYIRIYKGSKYFSKIYGIRGNIWFLGLFILINFSYYFIYEPIFIAMLFQNSKNSID